MSAYDTNIGTVVDTLLTFMDLRFMIFDMYFLWSARTWHFAWDIWMWGSCNYNEV